jgi:hypothetical protein
MEGCRGLGGRGRILKSSLIQTDASDSADTVRWEQRTLLHEVIQLKVREVGRGGKRATTDESR